MIFNSIPIYSEPSAPRNPCIFDESGDGIELNWIPPLEPNGDVHYVIYHTTSDEESLTSNSSDNQPRKSASDSTYFHLTGLQRGVTYNITLVAVNIAGRSDHVAGLNYRHKHLNESMG